MKKEKTLVDYIGVPATLEQTGEECSELSFAALKLARMMRGENKVHGHTEEELKEKLTEECCDILVCINELLNCNLITIDALCNGIEQKEKRMKERLTGELEEVKKPDKIDPMDILMNNLADAITDTIATIIMGPAPKEQNKDITMKSGSSKLETRPCGKEQKKTKEDEVK